MNLMSYQPKAAFSGKHMLTLADYSQDEIYQILSLALNMKANKDQYRKVLCGKNLAMIFAKSSTRTRVSFEVGMVELGGYPLVLSSDQLQLGRGETVEDTARVLSRFVQGIMIRTFNQSDVETLATAGSIPIINALTDDYHPCQVLADLQTTYEKFGRLEGLKLAYLGDGNNMTHSLMIGCAKMGMDVAVGCPSNHMPNPKIVEMAQQFAKASGATVTVTNDPKIAAMDAHVLYGDVWRSMGQSEKNIKEYLPFQINDALFSHAHPDAVFMHCLPAHRGEEVTGSIIDGPRSVVFDEAENRLHAQKAVLALLMGNPSELV